ncbi:MAG: hypothetical protein R3D05_07565 [Dongiaceae bacterium]
MTGLSVTATEDTDGITFTYTLDVADATARARGSKPGFSVEQIEELMDHLSSLRSASQTHLAGAKNATAPVGARLRRL